MPVHGTAAKCLPKKYVVSKLDQAGGKRCHLAMFCVTCVSPGRHVCLLIRKTRYQSKTTAVLSNICTHGYCYVQSVSDGINVCCLWQVQVKTCRLRQLLC